MWVGSVHLPHCLVSVCINALLLSFVSVFFAKWAMLKKITFFFLVGQENNQRSQSKVQFYILFFFFFLFSIYFVSVEKLKSVCISNLTTLSVLSLIPRQQSWRHGRQHRIFFSNIEEFSYHSWQKAPFLLMLDIPKNKNAQLYLWISHISRSCFILLSNTQ